MNTPIRCGKSFGLCLHPTFHPLRCSTHRGSVVPFSSCLNLSRRQFAVTPNSAPRAVGLNAAFRPKFGPSPVVATQNFRPAPVLSGIRPPVQIMANPRNVRPANFGHAVQGIVRPVPNVAMQNGRVPHAQALRGALLGGRGGIRPPVLPHVMPMARPPMHTAGIATAAGVLPGGIPPRPMPMAPRGRGGVPRGGGTVRPAPGRVSAV